MTTPLIRDEEQIFDASRYLKLEIDKDGGWIQNGVAMTHPGIRKQFFTALSKTEDGGYIVRIGREICSVLVHDAPFVVTSVDHQPDGTFLIKLSDETSEILQPDGLWIGNDNVPYSKVKNGVYHARFSRAAYYQLARHIALDEKEGKYYLSAGDQKFEIPVRLD